MWMVTVRVVGALTLLAMVVHANVMHELTTSNFQTMVRSSPSVWVVEFYSPTCPYCKEFAPEYDRVATSLDGAAVQVGRVDGVRNDDLSAQYNIHGYPTVKIFRPGSAVPEDYNGPRRASVIVDMAKSLAAQKTPHVRSFGDSYLDLPMTLRVEKPKRRMTLDHLDANDKKSDPTE